METVYIAGGTTYQKLVMSGMNHPMVYQLWSTPDVEIVDDGRDVSRYEKIRRLAGSDTVLRWLRVCWENRNDAYNCGECSKCLQTMLFLLFAGALDRCETFERPLSTATLRRITIHSRPERIYFMEALALARKDGRYPELVEALCNVLGVADEEHPDNELQGQLDRAERRVRELEAELYYLTASRSWRLTALLRAASVAIRRGKRRLLSWKK